MLLEKIVDYEELCSTVADALNTMYCAELPRNVHVKNLVENHLKFSQSSKQQHSETQIPLALLLHPMPNTPLFQEATDVAVCRCNMHKHTCTAVRGVRNDKTCSA